MLKNKDYLSTSSTHIQSLIIFKEKLWKKLLNWNTQTADKQPSPTAKKKKREELKGKG